MKDIYVVSWHDAVSMDSWEDDKINLPPHLILSVGFLISIEETHIVLALNNDIDSDSISCIMSIPKNMILKMKKLTMPKKQKDKFHV